MGERPYPLILAKWPMPDARALDPEAGPEIDWLIRLVGGIRAARSELSVPPGAKLTLHVQDADDRTADPARSPSARPSSAWRGSRSISAGMPAGGAAQIVVDEATFILPLEGVIDVDAEKRGSPRPPRPRRRSAMASPRASPIRASSSAPSPRRWRRRGRTMTRRRRRRRNIAPRWRGSADGLAPRPARPDLRADRQDPARLRAADACSPRSSSR